MTRRMGPTRAISTAVGRLIDANLNRSTEGLRAIEDVLRFGYDDAALSGTARDLRHAFAKAGNLLAPRGLLLLSRDSAGDVGAGRWRSGGRRSAFKDMLFANFRRVQESARVLEESARLSGRPMAARRLQALRYRAYALEKGTWLKLGRR